MAEIDNWIKEQLKKGFKKEQIKEGLRKAGYTQDIIDSVDSMKKPINKTYVFYVLLGIFLIVLCFLFFKLKAPDSSPAENTIFELVSEPVIINDNGSVSIDMEFKRNDVSDLQERIIFNSLLDDLKVDSNLDCEITPVGFGCILNKEKEYYFRISGRTDGANFDVYQLMCSLECKEFKLYRGIVE